jgi:hypothetical protein
MHLIHERVEHKSFGIGEVIDQAENIILVRFSESGAIKKFIFPDSFETFLSICNESLATEIEAAVHAMQLQKMEENRIAAERQKAFELELKNERQAILDSRKRSAKKPR